MLFSVQSYDSYPCLVERHRLQVLSWTLQGMLGFCEFLEFDTRNSEAAIQLL